MFVKSAILMTGENTSLIPKKRIYWEGQPQTPNGTSLTL